MHKDAEISLVKETGRHQFSLSPGQEEALSATTHAAPHLVPFFTVVDHAETGEATHPNVHYIFDDDDASLLTSAAIDVVESGGDTTMLQDNPAHHIAIVDLDADGQTVVNVSSLSRGWQAIRAEVTQAPSWSNALEGTDRGLMLRLGGKDVSQVVSSNVASADRIDELVEAFDREMQCLDEIVRPHDDVH